MKLNDAHRMQLTEAKFVISGIPILEDGEGPTWNMDYSNWKNDPHPRILLLGSYRHPSTGNNLVGGVNLNYLSPQQVNNLSKVLPKIMGGNNLYQRYHRGKDVLPDVFDNFYRTYDPRYISGVKQGVIYPKKGFLKTAQDFLKKTAGLLYKSKEQRAKDALPKFGSDLTSMQSTLDQAVTPEVPELPDEDQDTPQVQAARNAFLRYQRERQLAQQQNVERHEDEPFLNAADDYENQQLGITPEPTSPSSPSPMRRPANQPPAQTQQRPEARLKDPLEITPDDPPDVQPKPPGPPEDLEESVRYYSPIHKRYIVESIRGEPDFSLLQRLLELRPLIATSAQELYDSWDFTEGGMCDAVSNVIMDILSENGIDSTEGGHDGDDHSYVIAYDDDTAYDVDIPHHTYEHGGGYRWDKIEGVSFSPNDVIIVKSYRPDWVDDDI